MSVFVSSELISSKHSFARVLIFSKVEIILYFLSPFKNVHYKCEENPIRLHNKNIKMHIQSNLFIMSLFITEY